jgi:hypothetical protein
MADEQSNDRPSEADRYDRQTITIKQHDTAMGRFNVMKSRELVDCYYFSPLLHQYMGREMVIFINNCLFDDA